MGWFHRRKDVPMLQPMQPFTFQVEDIFTITGRGTVFTGRVESGAVQVGQSVRLNVAGDTFPATIKGIEHFGKKSSTANAGDSAGLPVERLDKPALARIHSDAIFVDGSSKAHNFTITSA
jgi:elongation factor Tu